MISPRRALLTLATRSKVSPLLRVRRGVLLRAIAAGAVSIIPSLVAGSPTDRVIALAPVVVTARPSERPLAVTIDPRAPAQPIPAQDGAEALRGIAGFNVIRKGGIDGDPVLRGMAGSRLGILLDGENILGGCGNRMDPPTAYVFPSAYDRVTVLKGPQSVLHGPGNSAGVVLFERTPHRFPESATKLQAALTLGSFGRNDQFAEVRAGRPSGYVELAASRSNADDYEDGDGRAISSAYERWSTRFALGWTPDNDTSVELTGIVSDGEAAYADRLMDGAQFARENLGLRLRRAKISPLVDAIEAGLFVNYVDHVMDNFSLRSFTPIAMMPGRAASNPDRLTFGGRAFAKITPADSLRATVGVDHQSNRHRNRSTSNNLVDPYETKARIKDSTFAATGLFAEATQEFGAAQRVVAGARIDWWRAQDFRPSVATGMMGTAVNPTAYRKRGDTLPCGFIRYERDLPKDFTVFAGVGHTQRFPDYWELFSKESSGTVSAFETRPERTTQLDLGINRHRGTFATSLSVFANRVDDFILTASGVRKSAGMMGTRTATIARNVETTSLGCEASLSWQFAQGWTADTAISAVRGTNETDDRPLAQQPPLEGRLGLSYATSRWSVGSLARVAARQTRYALNQGNIVGQDLGPSPGFAVFSLNAAWKPHARLQLSAGVDNISDRTYAEHLSRGGSMVAGFPAPTTRVNEPGRSAWLKLDFNY